MERSEVGNIFWLILYAYNYRVQLPCKIDEQYSHVNSNTKDNTREIQGGGILWSHLPPQLLPNANKNTNTYSMPSSTMIAVYISYSLTFNSACTSTCMQCMYAQQGAQYFNVATSATSLPQLVMKLTVAFINKKSPFKVMLIIQLSFKAWS